MTKTAARGAIIGLLLLLALGAIGAGAQSGLTFFITDVNAESFPAVNFRLRAADLSNEAVSGLSEEDLTVFEDGENVGSLEVTPHDDGPITYIFVIDLGRLSNFRSFGENRIRQILTTLPSGGYFVDGQDTIIVLGRRNETNDETITMMPATQSSSDLTTAAANFNLDASRSATKGLVAVEDAVRQADELVPIAGSQTTAIIFLTRYIEDPTPSVAPISAQNVAALARDQHISIHVLHTDFSGVRADALQVLAEGSGGSYTRLNRNNFQSAVTNVYQSIDAQRSYFDVSYRSSSAETAERQITVNNPTDQGQGRAGQYEVNLAPPEVSLIEPTPNSNIRREATINEDDEVPSFDLTNLTVRAETSFPDGFPRNIQSAQLLVNDEVEDTVEIGPGQTTFAFDWDLSDISDEGVNLVTLEIQVEDELGMSGDAQSSINVEVILPEESGGLFQSMPQVAAIGLPILCLLGLIALAVVTGIFFLARGGSKSKEPVAEAGPPTVQPTVFVDSVDDLALATLTVLEGPSGMIGEPLNITSRTTHLGRDPKQTDISFYSDTQSTISRLHATIELDEDNEFRLIDNSSSVGTRLNGRPIPAHTPVRLDDGDEIVLADLSQRGVKMRFNFISDEGAQAPAGTADDRTHLLTDFDLPLPGDEEE